MKINSCLLIAIMAFITTACTSKVTGQKNPPVATFVAAPHKTHVASKPQRKKPDLSAQLAIEELKLVNGLMHGETCTLEIVNATPEPILVCIGKEEKDPLKWIAVAPSELPVDTNFVPDKDWRGGFVPIFVRKAGSRTSVAVDVVPSSGKLFKKTVYPALFEPTVAAQ